MLVDLPDDVRSWIDAARDGEEEAVDRLRQHAGDAIVRGVLEAWVNTHPSELFIWTLLRILAEETPWLATGARTRAELAERIRQSPDEPSTVGVVRQLAEATVSEGSGAWLELISLLRTLGPSAPAQAAALPVMVFDLDLATSADAAVIEYFKEVVGDPMSGGDARWWAACALALAGNQSNQNAIDAMASLVVAPHINDACRFVLLVGLDQSGCRSSLEAFVAAGGPIGELALRVLPAVAAGEDADSLLERVRTAADGLERFSAQQRLKERASLRAVRSGLVEWIHDHARDPFAVEAVGALAAGAAGAGSEVWRTIVSTLRPFPWDSPVHEAALAGLPMELHREKSLREDTVIVDYLVDVLASPGTSTKARRLAAGGLAAAAHARAVEAMAAALSALYLEAADGDDARRHALMFGFARAGQAGRAKVEAFAADGGELGELARLALRCL